MSNWITSYFYTLLRFRWLVLLGVLAVTAIGFYGLTKTSFKSDYRIFFSEDNPQLQAHDALERTFTKADSVMFVVQPREGTVFQPRVLEAIQFLTEESWQMAKAIRVDSITNYQHTRAVEDDLTVEDLVTDPYAMTPEDLAYIEAVALNEPFLAGKSISRDARTTGVSTTFQLPDDPGAYAPAIAAKARSIQAEALEKYPEINVELTGTVMLNNSFAEVAQDDVITLYPLMIAFLLITMIIFLRSAFGAISAIVLVFLSATIAYGIAAWFGIAITSPSTTAYVIILTVAIADSIHVMVTMFAHMREGHTKREALAESLRVNMQPIFLTTLTTAIGFLSLNFSDAPPLRDLGNISAIGTVMAFFYSITLLPIMLDALPIKASARGGSDRKLLLGLADFTARRRVSIVVTTLMILGISLYSIFVIKPEVNDKFVEFFSEDLDFRTASDFSLEHLTGIYIVEFAVGSGEEGGISDPDYLERVDRFVEWLYAYPPYAETGEGVAHVNAFPYVMRRINRSMNGDDPAAYRLPEERPLAAQYLLLYEMSLPEGQDLNNQIDVDKASTRVSVTMGDVSSLYIRQFAQDAEAWLRETMPPAMHSKGSGVALMFSFLTERNVLAMVDGTGLAFLLISLTLLIALRSVKMGAISLLPNIIPALIVFGVWTLLYGRVGLYAAFTVSTALGLIVDFTVHFLSKYLRARREQGLGPEDGVRYALSTVGSALWVSAFVLIAGFMALTLSDFQINALMGLLTAMIIAVALVTDFLFLPALLLLLDRDKSDKEKTSDELATQPS